MSTPVAPGERLVTLDIVRGIAILMVVFVNVIALSGPQMLMMDPHAWNPPTLADQVVHYGVRVFVAGKFISIFALLYGIGLALQCDRLERRGPSAPIYRRRQLWLLVFGVLHGVLLWWGDILFTYGLIGLAVFLVRKQPSRDLRRLGAVLIGLGAMLNASAFLAIGAIPSEVWDGVTMLHEQVELPPDAPEWVFRMLAQDDPFRMLSVAEVAIFGQGPWWAALLTRGSLFVGTVIGGATSVGIWVGGLMLVGMAWIREGFLQDEERQRWWAFRVLPVLLAIELLANLALALGDFRFGSGIGGALEGLGWAVKPPLGLAYFAALCLLVRRLSALRVFASAGRLALTNYIAQSFVLNVLFAHWGFAWFGTLGRAATFGICVVLVTCQVGLSWLWLQRFERGPLEAVWRRLTYGAGNPKSGGSRTSS